MTPSASDVEPFWAFFRHLFPQFSPNHLRVYRLLWRIEPIGAETIIQRIKLARATTYKILNELVSAGLIKKTTYSPVCYYAENPVKAYTNRLNELSRKLKKGKNVVQKIVENETSLSEELYLIELDGGQKRLMTKNGRQMIMDEYALREIRQTIDQQIKDAERAKMKPWMIAAQ